MKRCATCKTEKPFTEFWARPERNGYRSSCKACCKTKSDLWRAKNPEKVKATASAWREKNAEEWKKSQKIRNDRWYAANKEKAVKRAAEWAKANPDKAKASRDKHYQNNKEEKAQYAAQWYAVNKDHALARKAEWRKENKADVDAYNAEWKRKNPHLVRASSMKRIAQKLRATPQWANEFFIEEAYDLAILRMKTTGIKHHVDHIVPLKSRLVCGLHWEGNMQVIPAKLNISKNNRYWPDMPEGRPHG